MALAWMATELVAAALPPAEAAREQPKQHVIPPASERTMWSLAFPQPPAVGKAIASEVLTSA